MSVTCCTYRSLISTLGYFPLYLYLSVPMNSSTIHFTGSILFFFLSTFTKGMNDMINIYLPLRPLSPLIHRRCHKCIECIVSVHIPTFLLLPPCLIGLTFLPLFSLGRRFLLLMLIDPCTSKFYITTGSGAIVAQIIHPNFMIGEPSNI